MSVDLVSIPSGGFNIGEHVCFCCLNDLKDQDVVGHDVVGRDESHVLSHFMDRECAKTWVKTTITQKKDLEAANCPTCRKLIDVASILTQEEIEECMPREDMLRNRALELEQRNINMLDLERAGSIAGISAATIVLATVVAVTIGKGPLGMGPAFFTTFASVIGASYVGFVASDYIHPSCLAYPLAYATAGTVIGAVAGMPLLTSAAFGAAAPFAIATAGLVGHCMGKVMNFIGDAD